MTWRRPPICRTSTFLRSRIVTPTAIQTAANRRPGIHVPDARAGNVDAHRQWPHRPVLTAQAFCLSTQAAGGRSVSPSSRFLCYRQFSMRESVSAGCPLRSLELINSSHRLPDSRWTTTVNRRLQQGTPFRRAERGVKHVRASAPAKSGAQGPEAQHTHSADYGRLKDPALRLRRVP